MKTIHYLALLEGKQGRQVLNLHHLFTALVDKSILEHILPTIAAFRQLNIIDLEEEVKKELSGGKVKGPLSGLGKFKHFLGNFGKYKTFLPRDIWWTRIGQGNITSHLSFIHQC